MSSHDWFAGQTLAFARPWLLLLLLLIPLLAWLRGKIAYVSMSRPEVGARLKAEFEALAAGNGA